MNCRCSGAVGNVVSLQGVNSNMLVRLFILTAAWQLAFSSCCFPSRRKLDSSFLPQWECFLRRGPLSGQTVAYLKAQTALSVHPIGCCACFLSYYLATPHILPVGRKRQCCRSLNIPDNKTLWRVFLRYNRHLARLDFVSSGRGMSVPMKCEDAMCENIFAQ